MFSEGVPKKDTEFFNAYIIFSFCNLPNLFLFPLKLSENLMLFS